MVVKEDEVAIQSSEALLTVFEKTKSDLLKHRQTENDKETKIRTKKELHQTLQHGQTLDPSGEKTDSGRCDFRQHCCFV